MTDIANMGAVSKHINDVELFKQNFLVEYNSVFKTEPRSYQLEGIQQV